MADSIQGLDKLLVKLTALGGNSTKVVKKGIIKGSMLVQGDAKELCPVDNGRLRNSIRTNVKEKKSKIEGEISTNVEYASYVEFGTGQKGDSANIEAKDSINLSYRQDWVGMEPQPFLYPAIKQNEDRVKNLIRSEIKKEIRNLGG